MGYVGRNSETELSSWAGLYERLDAPRPPSTVISFEWFVVHAVGSTAACRIQNFAEACLHASPSLRLALYGQLQREAERG